MTKFVKILLYILLGLSGVAIVLFYVQSSSVDFGISNMRGLLDSFTMIDGLIWLAYILVALTLILVVALSIYGMIKNPKSLKSTGIVLLLAVVLIVVSYFLASGDPVVANVDKEPTFAALKMTDTGLIMTYILFGAAILALLSGSVIKAIRNR